MPPGHLTFTADSADQQLLDHLLTRFPGSERADGRAGVLLTSTVPDRDAQHIIVTGPVTEALDAWDRQAAPQTIAGALWIAPDQQALDPATAWLLLRAQTPATPLSDLTDDNGRALRWSVAAAEAVCFPPAQEVEVDEQPIRDWADEQPQVQELGNAVERIGGQDAEAVLNSVERFQDALLALDELAAMPPVEQTRDLANAVAAQLQQVQRSGLSRWRSGKARAEADARTKETATQLAAARLQTLIEARSQEVAQAQWAERNQDLADEIRQLLLTTVEGLQMPVSVDFSKSPRPWSQDAPGARRYIVLNAEQAEQLGDLDVPGDLSVRHSPDVARDTAICAVVQSGFSLPALR